MRTASASFTHRQPPAGCSPTRDSWGLLVFNQDKGQLRVAREAPRGGERGREDAGLLRQQALAAALIKDLPALRSAL